MSLPMWERGLKHEYLCNDYETEMSLPMWERGLKHQPCTQSCHL